MRQNFTKYDKFRGNNYVTQFCAKVFNFSKAPFTKQLHDEILQDWEILTFKT
jgi:hypothetical protein